MTLVPCRRPALTGRSPIARVAAWVRPRLLPWVALTFLFVAPPERAHGQERIGSYHTEVEVRKDGVLDVTERITVRAEGQQIRRGIYRDFPTRYQDRYGNQVRVGFEVVSVERNGELEPWFTETVANGVRLNTGNDDFLPVPAEHTFTLRYRTTRQLGFFEEHDELYWNAIGTGWVFPIEDGTVEMRLPEPVPVDRMSVEGYTGPQGAQGQAYEAEIPAPGVARYRLTAPLAPREGFTTVLTFPKGVVEQPTTTRRARWFLADNRGALVALAGWLGLLTFALRRWGAVGRDPPQGVVIPRYDPPEGHGPGGLRYMRRYGYDPRCFSGDVLAMGVAGRLRIHRDDRFLRSDGWALERIQPADGPATVLPPQRTLLERIFSGGDVVELKTSNARKLQAARSAHRQALDQLYHGRFFKRNGGHVAFAVLIAVVTIPASFALSGGNAIPVIVGVTGLILLTIIAFARLVRAPTREGRALLDEIEGLALYLGVAERDDLARLRGPGEPPVLDAKRYEELLPYAVALDVEDAWTQKFTAAVGAAAAAETARHIGWYRGDGPLDDLSELSDAVGSELGGRIASASTPPGSSSGAGGGGSSGGGGGGGGGGGR